MAAHPYKLQDTILFTAQQINRPAVIIPGLYQEVLPPAANPLRAPEVLANQSLAPAHCNLHKINKKDTSRNKLLP